MKMLSWMCGKTRKDIIRNTNIRDMVKVAPIQNNLRENRLRWYGHVCRRPIDVVVKRSDMIIGSEDTRGRDKPKLILDAVVKYDIIELNLSKHLALNSG